MATVYLAEDVRHRRRVAIKVLHPELAHAVGPDRFLREIEIAAQLQHPHILPLLDSGAAAGLLYYVMPYVQGESLRNRLTRERQLPLEDVLQIARQIASALAYAHEQGVVHRDIKPENILLGADHAVLADFGIARALSAAGGERLTETGLTLGTPAYMSPEQASGERHLDSRSDIYSLGCVVYEMLAGEPPFTGPTVQAIIAKRFGGPVPRVRVVREELPEAVDRALERALAKAPADRFRTAATFSQALVEAATARRVGLIPRLTRRRSAGLALIGGFTLVALLLLGLVIWRRPVTDGTVDPALVLVLPFEVADADSSLRYLREGMADLLSMKLTGEGGPRAVDSRAVLGRWSRIAGSPGTNVDPKDAIGLAKGFRAGRLIQGSIVGTSSHLILTASVIRVPEGGTVTRASVAGPVDNLPLLVDRLTSQVLAGEAGRTDLASLTTLPALRAYLDGKSAIRAGHPDEALKDLDHALRIDSTFVLAALEFQEASGWASGWLSDDYGPGGVLRAWPFRDRLSPRDHALLVAHAGPRFPLPSTTAEFLEAAEQAVAAAPERAEAWYKLGDEYFHWGALLSLPHPLGQAAAAFRRAEELDSAAGRRPDAEPLGHLLEIAAYEGDTAGVRRLGARALANPGTEDPDAVRWLMAYVLGDSAALSNLRARFNQMSFASLTSISLESQQTGLAPEDARRAVNAMLSTAKTQNERRWGLLHLYGLALNGGRPAEAQAARRQHGGEHDWNSIDYALFWGGDSTAAAEEFRELVGVADGPLTRSPRGAAEHVLEICRTEAWRLANGDFGHARSAIARLRGAIPRGVSVHDSARTVAGAQTCAEFLEAWWASATRQSEAPRMIIRLDSLARTSPYGWNPAWNLVVARLLESQGDKSRALTAVRRRDFGLVPRYLATFLRDEGRLAALNGDTAGAIIAYRHYLGLRSNPEPTVRPEVEQVRSELAALVAEPK
jgi:hypothetical protein